MRLGEIWYDYSKVYFPCFLEQESSRPSDPLVIPSVFSLGKGRRAQEHPVKQAGFYLHQTSGDPEI